VAQLCRRTRYAVRVVLGESPWVGTSISVLQNEPNFADIYRQCSTSKYRSFRLTTHGANPVPLIGFE